MKNIRVIFEEYPTEDGIEVRVRAPERTDEVEALIEHISGRTPEMIAVTGADGAIITISPRDIVSLSVSGKFVQIVTETDRYTVRQSLLEFEKKLEAQRFVRISRYEIVNLNKVQKFDFTLGGTLRLELVGGMETWASRRNIPLIRKKLTEKE